MNVNLSPFGKISRKLGIDMGLSIARMAMNVGYAKVTYAEVERGNFGLQPKLCEEFIQFYKDRLTKEDITILRNSVVKARNGWGKIVVHSSAPKYVQEMLVTLYENLNSLTEGQARTIINAIDNENGGMK